MSPITASASDIRPPPPRPWTARKRDQLLDVLGEAGQQRADHEGDDGDLEQQPPAVEVGDLAPQRGGGGGGQHVGGDHPGQLVQAAELGGDPRQRGADDALVEGGEEHAGHQAAHDHEDLLVAEVAVGVGGHAEVSCGGRDVGWASGWVSRLSTSRASRARSVSRSSSDQPSSAVDDRRAGGSRSPRQAGAAVLGDRDPAGAAVVGVPGALEQPLVLELAGVPAHGRGVEAEDLGDRGEPHRALVGEQLEDRERGVVDARPRAGAAASAVRGPSSGSSGRPRPSPAPESAP